MYQARLRRPCFPSRLAERGERHRAIRVLAREAIPTLLSFTTNVNCWRTSFNMIEMH